MRRGTGLMAEEGMLFSELAIEVVGETGRLVDAAVEGLRSWAGSGWRFMEADWIVEAMSTAGLDILWCCGVVVVWWCGDQGWNGGLTSTGIIFAGRAPKYWINFEYE